MSGTTTVGRLGELLTGWRSGLVGVTRMALSGGCAYRLLTRIANSTVTG